MNKVMDMEPVVLPSCWVCQRRMKYGVLAAFAVREVIADRNEMPDGYRPVIWRYLHKDCQTGEELLADTLPVVYVAWIRLTLRLIDMKTAQYLFDITNWRYVLDCVQQDYIQGLNEYENPPLKRGKTSSNNVQIKRVADPEAKTRAPLRRARQLPPRRSLARK